MRALIVDDEPPIRRLLRAWSEAEGVEVDEAGSAEQALQLVAERGVPAVGLFDLRLPGHDGIWLAEQFRVEYPETAIVVASAVHEFDAALHSLQARVVDYLVKPYTHERFVEAFHHALMVHRARRGHRQMERELAERRAQIAEALAEIEANAAKSLEAMRAILRLRDPGSVDHSERVAVVSVNLALAMGIGEPQLSDIERAALLHNLGRVALPDSLLAKPEDALTAEERARRRSLPLHGYALMQQVPFLAAAAKIAVAAYERFDGSGFPHGLRAGQIPLGARIVAVAHFYDELVHGIGRPKVTPRRAVELLSTELAHLVDPAVVDALRRLQPQPVSR